MLELALPIILPGRAFLARVPGLIDFLRNLEGAEVPADVRAGGGDLGIAKRRTMHVVAALLVRRAGADHRPAADQRWLFLVGLGRHDGGMQRLGIVAIDVGDDLPAVSLEALRRVVGEPTLDMTVD